MTAQPTSAVIYARISDDSEGQAAGVERQVADCLALAERLGWHLVEQPLIDNDISASTRSKARRPSFERLVEGVRAGEFDGIVYYSNSRLTRRPMEYETIIGLVEQHGVRLASVASGMTDLTTADGRMIGRMLAAQDTAEAERIGERVARKFQQRREQGLPNPSRRAFGFKAGGIEIELAEADAIREAAAMLIAGASLGDVRRRWTEQGVQPVHSAAGWSNTTVRGVLVKPRVAGLIESRGEIVGPGNFEAPLDRATWDQMVAALADRSALARVVYKGREHLLSGLLWCSLCGKPVKVNALRTDDGELRRDSYVVCSRSQHGCGKTKRNLLALQEYVYAAVEARLETMGRFDSESGDALALKEYGRVKAEREQVEADIADLRKRFARRQVSNADFFPTLQGMREYADELDAELITFQSVGPSIHTDDVLATWRDGTFAQRRVVIESVVERIVLRPVGKVGPVRSRAMVPETTEIDFA